MAALLVPLAEEKEKVFMDINGVIIRKIFQKKLSRLIFILQEELKK